MSTKNVVDVNVASPKAASWHDASESAATFAGNIAEAFRAVAHWLDFQLSRLTSPMFTEYEASAALIPVPLRNETGRNGSWH